MTRGLSRVLKILLGSPEQVDVCACVRVCVCVCVCVCVVYGRGGAGAGLGESGTEFSPIAWDEALWRRQASYLCCTVDQFPGVWGVRVKSIWELTFSDSAVAQENCLAPSSRHAWDPLHLGLNQRTPAPAAGCAQSWARSREQPLGSFQGEWLPLGVSDVSVLVWMGWGSLQLPSALARAGVLLFTFRAAKSGLPQPGLLFSCRQWENELGARKGKSTRK